MPTLPLKAVSLLALACVALSIAAPASARLESAALDLELRAGGFYVGLTHSAEPATALSSDRRSLGSRPLHLRETGWDVAELQLALAWQGFPSGRIDGRFGLQLAAALARFQRAVGVPADPVAAATTIAALRREPLRASIPLAWPLLAPLGDGFGPRGSRFHGGLDLIASAGTPVTAAAPGRVTWAGSRPGGWGKLVTLSHGHGVRTMYAHLSTIRVKVGQWIAGGTMLGRVGATGDATGPHLHFEVRVGAAAIDPLHALVPIPARVRSSQSG
ncbi:MAG TPA: peptidoglycan DD-metalloendopeptidase family protein [bacterium]|nr:peptidoglycan DD-metalloendopeptidase family protein [bacterium]